MTRRIWVRGANRLWSSYDPVIRKQIERKAAKAAKEAEQAARKAARTA